MPRSFLQRFAPTWRASPLRRVIQTACFAAFLVLFFYVCCPYTVQQPRQWGRWLPTEVDATTGRVVAAAESPPPSALAVGEVVHPVDAGASPPQYLGPMRVAEASQEQLVLLPQESPAADALDRLSMSLGPWTLHENSPGSWPSHYAKDLQRKEAAPAELFLILDPLVSISTAIAARAWIWSLAAAGAMLAVCILVPRGFCGYVCPLGTLIDVFDWLVGRRVHLLRRTQRGWWVHLKYYLLATVLVSSLFGVLVSGFVAAIPVITRGLAFLLAPLQTGWIRGWYQVPPMGAGQYISIGLFLGVLALGLLRPRFWCRYVCPTGAVFSFGNLFRASQRKVNAKCIDCGKCVKICPFDAIDEDDFSTRTLDCTLCRTCGAVCPTGAIVYTLRCTNVEPSKQDESSEEATPVEQTNGRRRFLSQSIGTAAGIVGGLAAAGSIKAFGADLDGGSFRPVRPPGSVPEPQFLAMCIRCGECYRACPNDVLQPLGFQQGVEGLWTPQAVPDRSGCEPSCNNCGQVCPTGAIRPLPLDEKRVARMGLAVVDRQTCLPYAGVEDCQLCVDECVTAGYHAVEFLRVGTEVDEHGQPVEGSGFLAPVVLPEKCVGCGLCQTRCRAINVVQKRLLERSAIVVEAGDGKEDRLMSGSYVALRKAEAERKNPHQQGSGGGYLPEFLVPQE